MPRVLFSSPCLDPRDASHLVADPFYYRNTAAQGWAALRQEQAWHPLHLMAGSIGCDSVVLDDPRWSGFERELASGPEVLCLAFTALSAPVVLRMARRAREVVPGVVLVLGGYGVGVLEGDDGLAGSLRAVADEICHGEGVAFLRELLRRRFGHQAPEHGFPPLPPQVLRTRGGGIPLARSLVVARALGCANGCSFCSTSAHFGARKLRLVSDAVLLDALRQGLQTHPGIRDALVYDEDFLADRDAALGLIPGMDDPLFEARDLRLTVFASVRSLQAFSVAELSALRVGTVFLGIESQGGLDLVGGCVRAKRGKEAPEDLLERLHAAGIHTIASLVGGWDGQTDDDREVESVRFAALRPTFYQILPLTALPGTPLWRTARREGRSDQNFGPGDPGGWATRLEDWIHRTERSVAAEGGPWFFRMAENHWSAVRSGDPSLRPQAHARRLRALLPLALACGPFFRGEGFRRRHRDFFRSRLRAAPLATCAQFLLGVVLVVLVAASGAVAAGIRRLRGVHELPRSRRTVFPPPPGA